VKLIKLTVVVSALLVATAAMASEDPSAEHVKWMKDLGSQMGALRKGVDVQQNAQAMQDTLKLVGAFWKGRNSDVAMQTCRDTFKGAAAVAKAGDDKEALASGMKMIGGGCKGCHDQHREKISDTVYKIK
jgi:cytochrome c556